jgi:hypothetical protein
MVARGYVGSSGRITAAQQATRQRVAGIPSEPTGHPSLEDFSGGILGMPGLVGKTKK